MHSTGCIALKSTSKNRTQFDSTLHGGMTRINMTRNAMGDGVTETAPFTLYTNITSAGGKGNKLKALIARQQAATTK